MHTQPNKLYDQDFYAWSLDMAAKIRNKNFDSIDIENVAEEIESLARSDYRKLISRLEVLIAHLLKWMLQPDKRSSGWRGTIVEQRRKINKLLSESPSLKYKLDEETNLSEIYEDAKNIFYKDTGLDINKLMADNPCPFVINQILNNDFYPDK